MLEMKRDKEKKNTIEMEKMTNFHENSVRSKSDSNKFGAPSSETNRTDSGNKQKSMRYYCLQCIAKEKCTFFLFAIISRDKKKKIEKKETNYQTRSHSFTWPFVVYSLFDGDFPFS